MGARNYISKIKLKQKYIEIAHLKNVLKNKNK